MTKVFPENALGILPLSNGFIVPMRKQETDPELGEEKMVVTYNLVSFEKESSSTVTRSVYGLAKFGNCYKAIEEQLENPFYWKSLFLPNGRIFTYFPDGNAKIFDSEARIIWEGTLLYGGSGAADFILDAGSLWGSFPKEGCIIKFNIQNLKEEIKIGGKTSAFREPEGLFMEDDRLYVCSSGNGKVWVINTNNFAVTEHIDFGEPVHQFLKVGGFTLIHLDSGVYKI